MTLVNPKPLGWAFGEILTSAQMNSFGTQIIRAVDGTGGGAYTLAAPLSLTGDTVTFDDLVVNDSASIADGDITLGPTSVAVALPATFSGAATFSSAATFQGDATIGNSSADSLTVNAGASFESDVAIGTPGGADSLVVNATATFNKNVSLGDSDADSVFLNAVIAPTNNGRMLTTVLDLPDSSGSHDIANNRQLYAFPSAPRTYTLSFTGAQNGDWFRIYNGGGSTITLAGILSATVAGSKGAMFVRVSGSWTLKEAFGA
ncbi:long tail fiber proximal subunit [Caudoviricetes sp.]|nr:long tail fiber proximal subunit [Caudoviricetes sp.]